MPSEVFDPTKESEKSDKLFTDEAAETLGMGNEELVKKIFRVSMNTLRTGDGHTRLGYTMANFAALLANLAAQSEKTTNENIKMQRTITDLTRKLYFLTIALLLLTFFQVGLALFQYPPEIKCLIQKGEPMGSGLADLKMHKNGLG